jgi:hypothetical protein
MSEPWFCRVGKNEVGPLSGHELKEMATAGKLAPTDLVRRGAVGSWVPANRVKGLVFAEPRVPVPTVPNRANAAEVHCHPDARLALPPTGRWAPRTQDVAAQRPLPADLPPAQESQPPPSSPALPTPDPTDPPAQRMSVPVTETVSHPGHLRYHLISESQQIFSATVWHVVGLIRYGLAIWKTRSLARRLHDEQFVLGKKMYQHGVGDPQLLTQIADVTKEIEGPNAHADNRARTARERVQLTLQLAASTTNESASAAGVGATYRQTVATASALDEYRIHLSLLRDDLSLADHITWRRIGLGYTAFAALLVLIIYLSCGRGLPKSMARTPSPLDGQVAHTSPLQAGVSPTVGPQTKVAWDRLGQIDIQLRALQQENPMDFFQQNYVMTGQINADYIDEELRQLIQDRVRLCADCYDVASKYQKQMAEIDQKAKNLAQLGANIGSTNENNPQGGAAAGQLFFGAIGAAAANSCKEKLDAEYGPLFQSLNKRQAELTRRHRAMASHLSEKYNLPFNLPM